MSTKRRPAIYAPNAPEAREPVELPEQVAALVAERGWRAVATITVRSRRYTVSLWGGRDERVYAGRWGCDLDQVARSAVAAMFFHLGEVAPEEYQERDDGPSL